jgi:hypothetical protein
VRYKEDFCFGRDQSKGYKIVVGSRRIVSHYASSRWEHEVMQAN